MSGFHLDKTAEISSLDFKDIDNITFAQMRELLQAHDQGIKFNIFNAAEKEKRCAAAVFKTGIRTPMVGPVVTDGRRLGLLYARIVNKKSFSRAIADNPEGYADYAHRFARMAKFLHSCECDCSTFPDAVKFYDDAITRVGHYTDKEKARFFDTLHSFPVCTTCLHGDMHIGNVITTEKEDLWIDLSEFSYGNPLFDVGMFHLAYSNVFACDYFNAPESELDAVNRSLTPYALMRMLYFISIDSPVKSNYVYVRSWLDGNDIFD